jgi:hypothetical protein
MAHRKGAPKTGGRKRGTANKVTVADAQDVCRDGAGVGEALATLVEVMRDKAASPSARVRAAECVLDRAHGKAAPVLEAKDPDFVPLTERLKFYAQRDRPGFTRPGDRPG